MKIRLNAFNVKGALLVASTTLLVACGSSDSASSTQIGQFIDDPVGGLDYSCVSGAQTLSGKTNDSGQFSFIPGQTCTFKVGNITLGTLTGIPADGKVTPQDVAGVSRSATAAPSALVIAQFLQSLNDGSSSGKIVIPTATSQLLAAQPAKTLVDSTGSISQSDLDGLVKAAGKTLVSAATAQSALDTQLASGVINKDTGAVSATAAKTLNSIVVTSAAASNPAGLTEQLTATGYYSDGSKEDFTQKVTWNSADTSTVTVNTSGDNIGLATGIKTGKATITASYTPTSGSTTTLKGTFSQEVIDATPLSLAIAFVDSTITSIQKAATTTLQAILTFTDNTTKYVSNAVTWAVSSLNGGAGTVDSTTDTTGKTATITGDKVGVLSILASYLSGSTTISSNSLSLSVNTMSGNAATGLAMSGAIISVNCTGTTTAVTATAADDGSYSLSLPAGASAPCLVTATSVPDQNGQTQTYYSSVASGASGDVVANITPITNLIVANAIGSNPSTSPPTLSAVSANLTNDKLSSATTVIQTALSASFGVPSSALASPLNGSIKPAKLDSGVNSDPQDSAIDQVMSQLNVASVSLSDLATKFAAPSSNATAITSAITTLATTKGIPTSVAAGCPYAISGLYALATVGSTNLDTNGKPTFSAFKIDFGSNSAWNGDGDTFTIAPDSNDPCRFKIASTTAGKNINVNMEVSRAGFIVATTFAPAPSTATSATMMPVGADDACNKSTTSYCSIFVVGIPVQQGVTLDDAVGTWQSAEWNLNKFTYQATPNNVSNKSEYPCKAGISTGSPSATTDPDFTCILYVNYFHQFVISKPTGSGNSSSSDIAIYGCDGLYQGGSGNCSTSKETGTVTTTMKMCTTGTNAATDCPSVTYKNGNTTSAPVYLTSVMNIFADIGGAPTVVGKTLAFRAPNKDLIGIFITGRGGPTVSDVGHSNAAFGGYQFQEQFGIILRPADKAVPPAQDSIIKRGQWKALNYRSDIASATLTNTQLTGIQLSSTNSNALTKGQFLVGPNVRPGTMISNVNGTTADLVCKNPDATYGCRNNGATNNAWTWVAVSLQISEQTQVYKVSVDQTNKNKVTRSFTDTLDANGIDVLYLDAPYLGMVYRPYVAATTTPSAPSFSESVSLRGNGFGVSAGTATLAQQLGGINYGTSQSPDWVATPCTMPGQTFTRLTKVCDGISTTGRFFAINLNY